MTKESGDTWKKEVSTTSTPQFQCPILKPLNYSLWAIRMQIILEANGLWEMIEPLESTQADNKKDKTAIAFLYQALPEEQLLQITKHKTAKAIWNALKIRHIGEERVQQARKEVTQTEGDISIKQSAYANKILKEAGMIDCNETLIPMDPGTRLTKITEGTMVNSTEYQSLIGCLRYLLHTRPDLSYSVRLLSRFMQEPKEQHMKAIRQVLRYVKGTKDYGITYKHNGGNKIHGFSDSSYGVNTQEGKGTTDIIFYYATAAATQALWLKRLLSKLTHSQDEKVTIQVDNKSAIALIKNPVFHRRSKHIDTKYHFIRECVEREDIQVEFKQAYMQLKDEEIQEKVTESGDVPQPYKSRSRHEISKPSKLSKRQHVSHPHKSVRENDIQESQPKVLPKRQAYTQLEDEEIQEEVQTESGDHEDYSKDDHEKRRQGKNVTAIDNYEIAHYCEKKKKMVSEEDAAVLVCSATIGNMFQMLKPFTGHLRGRSAPKKEIFAVENLKAIVELENNKSAPLEEKLKEVAVEQDDMKKCVGLMMQEIQRLSKLVPDKSVS
ncbi:ribonuclease H-like domain, reverse transcriptase, RNA-dependent DNA polymerase [Tanacetum coccineum]